MFELPSKYEPNKFEDEIYRYWEESGFFKVERDESKKAFTIVIPPPNVTGILHMGHVLNNTLQDIMIRWKRLSGYNALWIPGTDHAGIATQNVVEKALKKEGKTKEDLGREKFLELVWEWREKHGGTIIQQLRKLGSSCDWDRERFTMDEGLSKSVKTVFIKLYEKGLVYRGEYIINWCPRCTTALADDEVEHEEKNSYLWYIKYPVKDSDEFVTVATTRPETMLGDTAVAVHPEDERFMHLIGKKVILPLIGRELDVIGDSYVDREFGTGVVKITPGHDPNDFEMGRRHNLPIVNIMTKTAGINENGGKYSGMDRFEARKLIIKDLQELGLLEKTDPHLNSIGHCYRCETVIEPRVSIQWFVNMKELSVKAIDAVRNETVKFHPKRWEKVYYNWMENIRDWCISRQIWWGHRIPAYYCDDCENIMVSDVDVKTCDKCGKTNINQDTDVLDTWFSSWLWPFSTLGWPEKTEDLDYFYPTDTLITAPEILFFWVARMVMAGYEFMGKEPFTDVYLHGIVRDDIGRKMSKSLGNSPDPITLIEKYGADSLRFSYVYTTPIGQDVFFSEKMAEMGRNFANKVLNASKLVIGFLNEHGDVSSDCEKIAMDKWIETRFYHNLDLVNKGLEEYRFNDSARAIYEFFWDNFCKWYLELVKHRIYGNDSSKGSALNTLKDILQKTLIVLHPFMPFLTELIYKNIPGNEEKTIMFEKWPELLDIDHGLEKEYQLVLDLITGIRTMRSETGIKPGESRKAYFKISEKAIEGLINTHKVEISKLCRLSEIEFSDQEFKHSSTVKVGEVIVSIPMSSEEINNEILRLDKELDKVAKELDRIEKKLSNKSFIDKAPEAVVEKSRNQKVELLKNQEILQAGKLKLKE
ncbi:valine--tRNA ligase [bacterium]|nr:valine--tRNA ligase [bacterium]